MALDFNLLGTGQTVDTVLSPREIFNALPSKISTKFQYPRDVQAQVWAKWFERKDEPNLVLKMNTGGGKTLVGLLILKSCLNEKKGPAVYIVPDNYLVKQVLSEATELGIEVTEDPRSVRFLSGKSILIVNTHKVVNGKSVFGVGDEGTKIAIESVVIDDAHACLGTIDDKFTLNLTVHNPAFLTIFSLFRDAIRSQCESKLVEIESGDPLAYIQVPYWAWQDKLSQVMAELVKNKDHEDVLFVWPLIKKSLRYCKCVISGGGIEISTDCIPIDSIPSLSRASRKIFMTATLADDSILATHFGVHSQHLNKPITPDTAGDVGDRLILLPQALNTDMCDDDVKKICHEISKSQNVVVVVPSWHRAEYWEDVSSEVLDKSNIYDGVDRLKKGHVGLVVLVNRYDGVDLPQSACRLLVIDGLPDARSKLDKLKQSILMGSNYQASATIQTIEQGMGRGIRSNDDYCVIFLMGKDLTSHLYVADSKELFSPATKAQLDLSEQVADQIQGKGAESLLEVINYCLGRNPEWVRASRGVLASLSYSGGALVNDINIALREAYDFGLINQSDKASSRISRVVNETTDPYLKAYLMQVMAEYINEHDPVEAQKTQKAAVSRNSRLIKPIDGITYKTISSSGTTQAVKCSQNLSIYSDSNKLLIAAEAILSNLIFTPNSANKFEQAMKDVASLIGFVGQRPENDYGKGPDVLWVLGGMKFLVIECKNEAYVNFISKSYCNQLNGSEIWFENEYNGGAECTPLLVHPSSCFEYASSPSENIKIINNEALGSFVYQVRAFLKSVVYDNKFLNPVAVEQSLKHHKLMADDFLAYYTVEFRIRTGSSS